MFYGEAALNLDSKGRLAIPVKYRDVIADACDNKLVLTYNAYENDSLWLYPQFEWEKIREVISKLPTANPANRAIRRRLVSSAYHIEPDKGYRIQLPVTLRQVASLEKKIVLTGDDNKFEIWNEDAFNKKRFEIPDLSAASSEILNDLIL
ncbi:MAG TPA: division/cell wall cluster transcriptional repressor MraZ [Oceanospirillales bacterium]|nr:division/cell wall cluster transcriptional repressor MraZ [Oceanospirillales bacterium]